MLGLFERGHFERRTRRLVLMNFTGLCEDTAMGCFLIRNCYGTRSNRCRHVAYEMFDWVFSSFIKRFMKLWHAYCCMVQTLLPKKNISGLCFASPRTENTVSFILNSYTNKSNLCKTEDNGDEQSHSEQVGLFYRNLLQELVFRQR